MGNLPDLSNSIHPPIKPDKGKLGGSCNRRACQAPGAWWWSTIENAAYCTPCAREINAWLPAGVPQMKYRGS